MTELDILDMARGTTTASIGYFSQIITINFAMIVAIYYFLNQARLAMKLFAFLAYMVGMALFFGEMLFETNMKVTLLDLLRALPHPSVASLRYVALYDSWLSIMIRIMMNGAIWILVLGVFYLLFFWKKSPEERDVTIRKA